MSVYSIFELPHYDEYDNKLDSLKIANGYIDKEKLQNILKLD